MRIPEFVPTLIESLPMRRWLLVLILLLPSTILAAESRWIKAASSNFELYTTAGDKKAREADPKSIEVRGVETGTADFTCGPQKPRRVRVEYEPSTDDKLGTSGVVRAIEFQ
jgi:hypothetical protein